MSTLTRQKPVVYCTSKPIEIFVVVVSLLCKSNKLHFLQVSCYNNPLQLWEEHLESLQPVACDLQTFLLLPQHPM